MIDMVIQFFEAIKCNSCKHIEIKCDLTNEQISNLCSTYYLRSTFRVDDFKPYGNIKGFK